MFEPSMNPTAESYMGSAESSDSPYFTDFNLQNAITKLYTDNYLRKIRKEE